MGAQSTPTARCQLRALVEDAHSLEVRRVGQAPLYSTKHRPSVRSFPGQQLLRVQSANASCAKAAAGSEEKSGLDPGPWHGRPTAERVTGAPDFQGHRASLAGGHHAIAAVRLLPISPIKGHTNEELPGGAGLCPDRGPAEGRVRSGGSTQRPPPAASCQGRSPVPRVGDPGAAASLAGENSLWFPDDVRMLDTCMSPRCFFLLLSTKSKALCGFSGRKIILFLPLTTSVLGFAAKSGAELLSCRERRL